VRHAPTCGGSQLSCPCSSRIELSCPSQWSALGTTSLFAALDVASGSVVAQHYRRHRHQEFLRYLKLIDDAVPDGLELHLVCGTPGSISISRPPANAVA
jgi:hypothetical protein